MIVSTISDLHQSSSTEALRRPQDRWRAVLDRLNMQETQSWRGDPEIRELVFIGMTADALVRRGMWVDVGGCGWM